MSHVRSSALSSAMLPHSVHRHSPFGRMFRHLPPFIPEGIDDEDREKTLEQFAIAQMVEAPNLSNAVGDNADLPAGYTYLGQFVDHDITFDTTSSLARRNDPDRLHNFRTPRLDLDSVYGGGPHTNPYLYNVKRSYRGDERDSRGFNGFLLEGEGIDKSEPDLPRNDQGTAIIGDPRNDENIIISQIQLAIIRLHNKVLDYIVDDPNNGATQQQFHEAQRIVRWFYQYIVWRDFVRRIVNDDLHKTVLKKTSGIYELKTRFYKFKHAPFIPVEFAAAAYRFGHSMVRPTYLLSSRLREADNSFTELPIFATAPAGDLRGGKKLPANHSVQWNWFLEFGGPRGSFPQLSRKIDTKLSPALSRIPGPEAALAVLNLKRGWRMGLPTGSAIAKAMGFTPIAAEKTEDALWHYVLKEAKVKGGSKRGKMLGPVGGTIVAEVFAGLLYGDSQSYIRCYPGWTPKKEPALGLTTPVNGNDWEFADLIQAAGMFIAPASGS